MKLLGSYFSNLNSFHYDALLDLLQQSIASGDYAGGKAFDKDAATKLRQQGQDFESLPLPATGQRVSDDSFNHPLNVLGARYTALQSETDDFLARANVLLAMLEKDTALVDQILAAAEAQAWAAKLPQLGNAQQFVWDFAAGHGAVTTDIPATDPETNIEYSGRPPKVRVLDCETGVIHAGIAAPLNRRQFAIKKLQWNYLSNGEVEERYGDDWAKLTLLESGPKLTFADQPTCSSNVVEVTGSVKGGMVPVYVNLHFVNRRSTKTVNLKLNASTKLTPYRVQPDEVDVVYEGKVFSQGVDFIVLSDGTLTSKNLPEDVDLTVHFTEYFPAYQCSVNQANWSPVVMFDVERPYPDDTTDYLPIAIDGDRFPITDELGVPTGLYMRLNGTPQNEVNFQVTTPASSAYGVRAKLEVELERPAYMTGLSLAPFSSFPAMLEKVICYGATAEPTILFDGEVVLDREMTLKFARRMVRRIELFLTQENYTVKEHTIDPPDKLRRDTLASLQTVLPFAVRRTAPATPRTVRGAQYELGFEKLSGEDWSSQVPNVFVTGPYRANGIPELVRLELDTVGDVEPYLFFKAYNATGTKVDDNENSVNAEIVSGQTAPVALSESLDRKQVAYTDFYLKFVFRSADAMVKRFFLQVASV